MHEPICFIALCSRVTKLMVYDSYKSLTKLKVKFSVFGDLTFLKQHYMRTQIQKTISIQEYTLEYAKYKSENRVVMQTGICIYTYIYI